MTEGNHRETRKRTQRLMNDFKREVEKVNKVDDYKIQSPCSLKANYFNIY